MGSASSRLTGGGGNWHFGSTPRVIASSTLPPTQFGRRHRHIILSPEYDPQHHDVDTFQNMKIDYSAEQPLNREPPIQDLISSFITYDGGYDRNHGGIPYCGDDHMVKVDGAVENELLLSVHDLKTRYQQHEITCALQCAGLRRHTMRTFIKEVSGIDWGDGAVMNCTWKGPRLRDILMDAGIKLLVETTGHVAFASYYTKVQEDDWYGGSILLTRAMRIDGDVILALEMNGKPLPVNHGYPVRAIVPGIAGCRSVKWLQQITVQEQESNNFYQLYDYKILPPEATDAQAAKHFWRITPGLQDMPVNSIIATPRNDEVITLGPERTLVVKGYALPYGDQGPVTKVEVSIDGGSKWTDATISEDSNRGGRWSWVLWSSEVIIPTGKNKRILSRAIDAGGNTQDPQPIWNLRGVGYNGYGESRNLTVR